VDVRDHNYFKLIFFLEIMTQFLDSHVDKSLGATGAWTDIDLSGDIPAAATGAIFKVINQSVGTCRAFGLRKKGSADAHYRDIYNACFLTYIVGVDSNRKCEGKIESTDVDFWLIGYTEGDGTIFTTAIDKSLGATGAWTEIDLSGQLPAGAKAAIFEVDATGSTRLFGLRKKGGTDEHYNDIYSGTHLCFIVGVDSNRKCEGKIENADVDFWLIGYLTGTTAETNGVDRSLGTTGSYVDITESNAPDGATGVFVDVISPSAFKNYAARKNGASDDTYKDTPARHYSIIVGLDSNKKWEGKIEATSQDFYTLGYFMLDIIEKTSSDTGTGVDADSGILASLSQSDTGSGIEALSDLMAAIVNAETGVGVDAILESLASRVESETGIGVDVLVSILKAIAKYSSDVGVGVDAITECLAELIQSEQGVGVEALGSRVFGSLDEGVGVDEILELALSGSDTGVGSDELKALLATIHGSDAGAGAEAQAIDICICLLLKLLQKKRLNIELSQDQKG
jgi:hypothetical protein